MSLLDQTRAKVNRQEVAILALQKELYTLKARIAELEKQQYLLNYKPKNLQTYEQKEKNPCPSY